MPAPWIYPYLSGGHYKRLSVPLLDPITATVVVWSTATMFGINAMAYAMMCTVPQLATAKQR